MCISASQCLLAFYLGCFAVRFAQSFCIFGLPRFVFGYFWQTRFNVRHCHLFVYVAVQLRARALSIAGGIAVVRSQCLLSFFFTAAYSGAHALPHIIVQYEQSSASTGRYLESTGFDDARAGRLAERIGRTGEYLAQVGAVESASFVIEFAEHSASFVGLVSRFPNVSTASLRVAFRSAFEGALLAESLPASEALCVRDYNVPCPGGWVDLGDGGSCSAPVSYEGPCGGELSFRGLAAHEKMSLAESCAVAFSCAGACSADYSQACPEGWSVAASGSCIAPAKYAGPCVGRKSFLDFAAGDKAVFENECSVHWPCRRPWLKSQRLGAEQTCIADHAQACPTGWATAGELCVAPASYAGPCSVIGAFGRYSVEEKRVISKRCGAPWPCAP